MPASSGLQRIPGAAARSLRRGIILTLITLLLLEGTLQAAAVVTWLWYRPAEHSTPLEQHGTTRTEHTILCVGDSWTYGIGSSDSSRSYPMQLAKILNQARTEPAIDVINLGWPGQNSRDVLRKLGKQVDEHRPRVTCIIVGSNDRWSLPDELKLEDLDRLSGAAPAFRWRWRTARLLNILISAISAPPENDTKIDEGAKLPLVPSGLEPARASALDDSKIRARHVRELVETGQREQAMQTTAQQRKEFLATPSRHLAETVMLSMSATGEAASGVEFGKRATELFAESRIIWGTLAILAFRLDEVELARDAVDRAVSLETYASRASITRWHHLRSRIYTMGLSDPVTGMQSIITAYLYHRDPAKMQRVIRIYINRYSEQAIDMALARPELKALLSETDRRRAKQIGLRGLDRDMDRMRAVLRSHLENMASICASRDCQVLICSYPSPHAYYEEILAGMQPIPGVATLDIRSHFDQLKQSGVKHSDLYVPDGHCNDRGYEIMARLIASKLRAMQADK